MTEQELYNTILKQRENGKTYGQIAGWLRKNANPPRLIISEPSKKKISYSWDAISVSNFMISKGYRVRPVTTRNHDKVKEKKFVPVKREKPQKQDDLFLKIASSSQFSVEEKQKLLRLML